MSKVYERILELCQIKGVTPGKMCNDLGYSRSTMTALKSGRSTTFKLEKAQRIAEYFGVSVDYLLGKEEKPADKGEQIDLSDIEIGFLGDYKELTEENKATIRDMVRLMRERQKEE